MKKNTAIPFVSTIISILLVIVFGEIYFRLFSQTGYITPEILKNRSLQYVPSLFARHLFPQKEQVVDVGKGVKYHINEKGYRGHNFTIDKPKGTVRIIFYGGSSVFDIWAPEDRDWPHRVEHILRQNGFPNVEVINAGIPGHASWDSVGRLFSEGHIFNPDYVVLYCAWNDIKYFRSDKPLLRTNEPYDGSSDPRWTYQNFLDRFLGENSQLYVRLREQYYNWKLQVGPEGHIPIGEYSSKINELGLKQYRLNVQMFVDLARDIGATPILMTEGRLVVRNNTEEQRAHIHYEYQLLTPLALYKAFEETDKINYEVAKEKNVFLIDTSKYISGKDEFFVDGVHLTDAGSEEVANITAREIANLLKQKE